MISISKIYKNRILKILNNNLSKYRIFLFLKRKLLNNKIFLYFRGSKIEFIKLPVKNILLAGTIGANQTVNNLELLINNNLQGNQNVYKLICDEVFSACFECTYLTLPKLGVTENNKKICTGCFSTGAKVNKDLTNLIKLSSYIRASDKKELYDFLNSLKEISFEKLINFTKDGIHLGEHAHAATLRFLAIGELNNCEYHRKILINFLYSAEITRVAILNLCSDLKIDVALILHGLYIPHGVINEVFNSKKIRTVLWNQGYRANSFIFSHKETYHKSLLNEKPQSWNKLQIDKTKEEYLFSYLKSRKVGTYDWITFSHNKTFNYDKLNSKINSFDYENTYLMLTNVSWDAQIHYDQNVFKNMWEWICLTIEWFMKNPEKLLIIRVHPAEVTSIYPSKERIHKLILDRYKFLPNNIIIIPSHEKASSYVLAEKMNFVIIYGTKMGIELAALNKKIIVCGESWIKNKGIVHEVNSKTDYFKILNENSCMETNSDLAKKFAYYFFFQRLIELNPLQKETFKNNLSVIIKGIVMGSPFKVSNNDN